MTTLSTTAKLPFNTHSHSLYTSLPNRFADAIASSFDSDARAMISIFGRTLFLLGLGTIGIVATTGQPPLFFLPLALFLFAMSAMQWGRPAKVRVSDKREKEAVCMNSPKTSKMVVGYDDMA